MKKLLILVSLVALIMAGCSVSGKTEGKKEDTKTVTNESQNNKPQEKDETKEETKQEYFIGLKSPIQDLDKWVARYERYNGVYQQKFGDYRAVLLNMGEKMNGGYQVKVNKVSKQGDKWLVEAAFNYPKDGGVQTEVINSPREVVSIIDDGSPIEVKVESNELDTVQTKTMDVIEIPEGKEFPVSDNFILFTPLKEDKISNPVKIKGRARAFEATFIVHLEDGHNVLVKKAVMADMGAPEFGYFEIELPYDKPTNGYGALIVSTESMKDGSETEELTVPVKF